KAGHPGEQRHRAETLDLDGAFGLTSALPDGDVAKLVEQAPSTLEIPTSRRGQCQGLEKRYRFGDDVDAEDLDRRPDRALGSYDQRRGHQSLSEVGSDGEIGRCHLAA